MTSAYLDRYPGDVTSTQLPSDFADATIYVAGAAAEAGETTPEIAVFQDDSPQFTLFSEAVAASMHTVVGHVEALDAPDAEGEAQHARTQELRSAIDVFKQKIDNQEDLVRSCEAKLAGTRTLLPPIWTRLSALQTTGRNLTQEYQMLKKLITPLVDELNHPEKLPTLSDIPCLCVVHGGCTDPETGAVVSSAEHLDELEKSLEKSQKEYQDIAQADAEIQFQSDAEQKIFRGTQEYLQRLKNARDARNRSERRLQVAEERVIGLQRTIFMIREAAQKRLDAQHSEIAEHRAAKETELATHKQSASETLAKLETAQTEYSEALKVLNLVEVQIERSETELATEREQLSVLLEVQKSDSTRSDTESSAAGSDPEEEQPSAKNPRRLHAVPDSAANGADTEASQTTANKYKKRAFVTLIEGL